LASNLLHWNKMMMLGFNQDTTWIWYLEEQHCNLVFLPGFCWKVLLMDTGCTILNKLQLWNYSLLRGVMYLFWEWGSHGQHPCCLMQLYDVPKMKTKTGEKYVEQLWVQALY
jgi:hypothetical protein